MAVEGTLNNTAHFLPIVGLEEKIIGSALKYFGS